MKLVVDKESLVSVADAIRTKGNTTDELEFPNGFVDGINAIESGGGGTEEIENLIDQSGVLDSTDGTATEKVEQLIEKASDEALWYMRTAEASDRIGGGWFCRTNLTRLPRMDLSKATSLYLFCTGAHIERIEQYLNTELCALFQQAFSGTSNLTYMKGICTKKATKVEGMFYESAIEIIDEPFDFSNVASGSAFQKANSLKEVRFVSETIKISQIFSSANLSAESIQSIIDGLATVETAQTLTLNATVKAKLTEEQLATITNKNWNLA